LFVFSGCTPFFLSFFQFSRFPQHFDGKGKDGKIYSGWVDAGTQEPVKDFDVKARYEEKILKHSGIRFIEPELFGGYDPNKKNLLQQIAIDHDMAPIEVSKEEAIAFKRQHGDSVETYEKGDDIVSPSSCGTCILPLLSKFPFWLVVVVGGSPQKRRDSLHPQGP